MLKAICFDFDGTLVDSERLHYAAWQAELQLFACSFDEADYLSQFSGVSTYATAERLIQRDQLPISTQELADRKTSRFLSLLETELPSPAVGAHELLCQMQQTNLAVALVTGSYRREIEPMLDNLGWRNFFTHIITRDDVQHAKPHPEPYLTALERLNLPAESCLALEDSATGIRSAHDAGLTVLAITTAHTTLADDVGFSALFYSLEEVGEYVQQLLVSPGSH
jgi:beta-phosphoglucomutase